MRRNLHVLKRNVTPILAIVVALFLYGDNNHAFAEEDQLAQLFSELSKEELSDQEWSEIEGKIWSQWSKSGSRSVDLLMRRGVRAMQDQRLNEAIGHFTAAIDHAPNFPEAWNKRATVYYMLGRFGLSVADIEQTLALEPRHFGALAGLGAIMERTDRASDALTAFQEALKLHPHRPDMLRAVERLKEATQGISL